MRTPTFLRLAALAILAAAGAARADGLIVVTDPVPVPDGHFRFAPLAVRHHRVTVRIEDQIAVTEVDQVFHNPTGRRLEGTYLFPIPRGAQIDRFAMDIDGTPTEAELLDADKAREIYEDIVRRMQDPALLEYAGQGLFKVRIFPIEPRSDTHVMLRYTQVLRRDGDVVDYAYPLNTERFSAAPLREVALDVEVRTTRPIASIYCPTHRAEIARPEPCFAKVGFEARDVRPDADFRLVFSTGEGDAGPVGLSMLAHRPSPGEPGFFLLLASPQAHADGAPLPKDVVFVVDTSGSMAGEKIVQAKRALTFCLDNLNDGDRFEIVRFSTEAEPLFGGLAAVTDAHLDRARAFVEGFRPIGGTALAEALLAARPDDVDASRPCMVIVLTDGKPTVGPTGKDEIVDAVTSAIGEHVVRYFSFGIGDAINTHLLDRLARETRAATQYVGAEEDMEIKISRFYTKIDRPVLANPVLESRGVRLTRVHPRPGALPDLFVGDQLVVLGRYEGDGDAAVTIEGDVRGERRSIVYETSFAREQHDHAYIPRLWATRRVGDLLDQIRLNGESDELRDEIVRLARRYGVVTPYTSYLIVEDEARRGVREPARLGAGFGGDGDRAYRSMREAETGADAVHAAKAVAGMRLARVVDEIDDSAANARFVAGRLFALDDGVWIDATIADHDELERVEIEFGTPAYFDLITEHPRIAPWLALGPDVDVRVETTVYAVRARS